MKKKLLTIIVIVALLITGISIILIRNKVSPPESSFVSADSIEEANERADFDLEYSDRLSGYPATNFKSNQSTIEVEFGTAGYLQKSLAKADSSGNINYAEKTEVEINGMSVSFEGENGAVYIAKWNYNNFGYLISLNPEGSGATSDEMVEYVEATK